MLDKNENYDTVLKGARVVGNLCVCMAAMFILIKK